jgi:hypothetical protein
MVEQEDGVSGCGEEDSRHSNGDDCSADPDSVSPRRSSAEECSDSEVSSHGSWEDQFGDSERRAWEESESRAFKRRKTSKGDKATAASEKAKEDKAELKKLRTTHEKLLKLHDALGKKHALLKMQVAETRKSNARDIKRLKDDHKDEIRKLKDGHKKYIADVKKDCNHDNDFALEYQKMGEVVRLLFDFVCFHFISPLVLSRPSMCSTRSIGREGTNPNPNSCRRSVGCLIRASINTWNQ